MKIAILTTDNRENDRRYYLPQPCFGTAPEALLQGFRATPAAEIHVVSCSQQALPPTEKLADNIWFHSLHVAKTGWLRTGYQGCIRAVRRKLREIRPDIVHGQGTERDCAMSAVWSCFPNVITLHGNMAEMAREFSAPVGSYGWLAARLENHSLRRTAGVLCNSTHTENLARPRTRRTWRVPNALREIFFAEKAARPANKKPVLLNAGVLCANKQQVEILRAAHTLHARGLAFELRFAGAALENGGYQEEFKRRLRAAEQAGFARHLGTLTAAEMVAAMDAADALVHFPRIEAFGLVAAEAAARNLKIFTARTGGLVDIVRDVDGAESFPAGDVAALTEGLAAWLEAGVPRPAHNAAAIRARYHPQAVAARHLEIYREVLGRS